MFITINEFSKIYKFLNQPLTILKYYCNISDKKYLLIKHEIK